MTGIIAGMFDLSTFVAGVVGIAGIGGTLIGGRMASKSQSADVIRGINAERELALLAEKRRIYAECDSSFLRCSRARTGIEFAELMGDAEGKRAATKENNEAYEQMNLAYSALALIAPNDVVMAASHVRAHLIGYDIGGEWHKTYDELHSRSVRYMRADLGVPY